MAQLDLVVIGDINPDIMVSDKDPQPRFGQSEVVVERIAMTIGGSAAIFACAAARLGMRVAIVGVVGADDFGRFMLARLGEFGVDISSVRVDGARATGASVVLAGRDDRAILTAKGTIETIQAADIPWSMLDRARHIHVASYFLLGRFREEVPEVFKRFRGQGGTTSLDPNWDPDETWGTDLEAALEHTNVFLPNRSETRWITGREDALAGAKVLIQMGASNVAIKLGPDGALVVGPDEAAVSVRPKATLVADTTGAGDAFDAGFLAGRLKGASMLRSLRLAVACATLSTRSVGGTSALPSLEEAQMWADQLVGSVAEGPDS